MCLGEVSSDDIVGEICEFKGDGTIICERLV